MTHTVNVAELKDNLSKYLAAVEKGDEVVICRRNRHLAKLTGTPLRKNKLALHLDLEKGFDPSVVILGDIEGPAIPEGGLEHATG